MSEHAKCALLVSALVVMAFMFGIEVGAFEQRQIESRRKIARYLAENYVEIEPGTFAPRKPEEPSAPVSGSGPES